VATNVKVPSKEIFREDVIAFLVSQIERNDGQEVAFVGGVDRSGLVCEADVLAWGNESAAPVVMMDALQGDVLIHNHPADRFEDPDDLLRASEADIGVASDLANRKIGFYIIDNACEWVNVIFRPEPRVYLKDEEIAALFDDGGGLSQVIHNFEPRTEQIDLVRGITDAVNGSKVLVAEAGTGTGKSLAYLIPAAVWAVQNKKRVVVSTHTINLQQQIVQKDMHTVRKVIQTYLGKETHFALLVGRGNYLCRRKLTDFIGDRERQQTLFADERDADIAFDIEEWSKKAEEGTLQEFGRFVKSELWEEIASDGLTCTRRRCPFYGDCFYFRARLDAEKANIIVGNHSLVFSSIDEETRRSSLPFFSGVIFDEAHHAEDTALKALSKEFSIQGMLYQSRKLYQDRGGRSLGLLALLEKRSGFRAYPEMQERFESVTERLSEMTRRLSRFLDEAVEILKPAMPDGNSAGVDDQFKQTPACERLMEEMSAIFSSLSRAVVAFDALAEEIKRTSSSKDAVELVQAVSGRLAGLSEAASVFEILFHGEPDIHFVRWIELGKRNVRFFYSPLEVGDFLAGSIFSKKDFTVFASATLQINKRFDYFVNSVGLPIATDKERVEMAFASPFNYAKQAEIHILTEEIDHGAVTREKTDLIRDLAMMSAGGVLILFTSYHRLKEVFATLRPSLEDAGILPLQQGDAPRDELLQKMIDYPNVALFATSSFWEGIDVQGDHLRCVIIEKIPFDSPGDPVFKAKVELLDSKGINSFMSYSIPRAVLRLKQGLGRLIRSKTDKGVIAILDHRLKTARYGPIFLNSLPKARIVTGGVQTLLQEAERFYTERF
jgi:ATP-dependent DNA helicase DinG